MGKRGRKYKVVITGIEWSKLIVSDITSFAPLDSDSNEDVPGVTMP